MMLDRAQSSDLLSLGIAELGRAYRQGHVSPVEVMRALFEAIGRDIQDINAFCHLDRDAAMTAARASEQRLHSGHALGPLDGIPVSIKDLLNVADWPTRRGSLSSADEPPAIQDSPTVKLLRSAGAMIFGKTTTTEFGWTILSGNPHSGITRNPHDVSRSAGGSSSGAAAQIAAGWGPLAIGSDAGGSVRIPASYCGVVGFKPTFGAIPLAPQSAFAEFAHLGPLTRNVEDCISAMSTLAQPDARDASSLYPRGPASGKQPLRIGWALHLGSRMSLDPEIETAFQGLLTRLESAGHRLHEVSLHVEDLEADMWTIWCSRVFESFLPWPEDKRRRLGKSLQQVYETGATQNLNMLTLSRVRLREAATRIANAFTEIDLLLTPATPTVAPPVDRLVQESSVTDAWFGPAGYAYPFNLTQQPALSLPLGRNKQGLPFGVQIAGRKYQDADVLAFGAGLEAMLGGRR